jgi:phage tail-like protein
VPAARDRPHASSNFLVEFGSGASRSGRTGFAEVVFAPFTIAARPPGRRGNAAAATDPHAAESTLPRLLLRRGVTGELDLYAWWDQARRGKTPPRRVMNVKLLAEDHATVVWTWRFRNVRPVSLSYSPLRGVDGGILMETIELSYDDVEMA